MSSNQSLNDISIQVKGMHLNDLKVEYKGNVDDSKYRELKPNVMLKSTVIHLPDGRSLRSTPRFWGSFSNLFNLPASVFKYWSYDEVFTRVSQRQSSLIQVAAQQDAGPNKPGDGNWGTALAVTAMAKPVVPVGDMRGLIDRLGGSGVSYNMGRAHATFPVHAYGNFAVNGDDFAPTLRLDVPLDGYGKPDAYLSVVRARCTNGAVMRTPMFRTSFSLGKDDISYMDLLMRALGSFNNEDGYGAIREQLTLAGKSWASYREYLEALKTLDNYRKHGMSLEDFNPLQQRLDEICGNPRAVFGFLGSANEVPARQAAVLPVKTTVYDLYNFMTEVSTHQVKGPHTFIESWTGKMLTSTFDLAGMKDTYPDYTDYFMEIGGSQAAILGGKEAVAARAGYVADMAEDAAE